MKRYADSEDIDVGIQKFWRFEDNLGRGIQEKMIRVSDEEKGEDMEETTQNSNVYRHRLSREDFSHHGFTELSKAQDAACGSPSARPLGTLLSLDKMTLMKRKERRNRKTRTTFTWASF